MGGAVTICGGLMSGTVPFACDAGGVVRDGNEAIDDSVVEGTSLPVLA